MLDAARAAGFEVRARRAVSYLRADFLKRRLPLKLMVGLDALLQPSGAFALFSPSVFVQLVAAQGDGAGSSERLAGEAIFAAPALARHCAARATRWCATRTARAGARRGTSTTSRRRYELAVC